MTFEAAVLMCTLQSKQISNRTLPFVSSVNVGVSSASPWLSDKNSSRFSREVMLAVVVRFDGDQDLVLALRALGALVSHHP
jgi:hypothetical protein